MKNKGFTLMELLVAVLVAGIFFSAVIGLLPRFLSGSQHNGEIMRDAFATYNAMYQIETDLHALLSDFKGSNNGFQFVAYHTAPDLPEDIKILPHQHINIQYKFEDKTLYRSTSPALTKSEPQKSEILTFKDYRLEYLNNKKSWNSVWPLNEAVPPLAIRLIMTDTKNQPWERTFVLFNRGMGDVQ